MLLIPAPWSHRWSEMCWGVDVCEAATAYRMAPLCMCGCTGGGAIGGSVMDALRDEYAPTDTSPTGARLLPFLRSVSSDRERSITGAKRS